MIPDDVARCRGVGDPDDWREGCEDCARRLTPPGDRSPWLEPPPIIVFWCDFHIPVAPNE